MRVCLPAALRSSMLGCEITCTAIRLTSRSDRASRPGCQALSAGPAQARPQNGQPGHFRCPPAPTGLYLATLRPSRHHPARMICCRRTSPRRRKGSATARCAGVVLVLAAVRPDSGHDELRRRMLAPSAPELCAPHRCRANRQPGDTRRAGQFCTGAHRSSGSVSTTPVRAWRAPSRGDRR